LKVEQPLAMWRRKIQKKQSITDVIHCFFVRLTLHDFKQNIVS